MAINSTQFREALKPQDMVAAVITLMGIAIVIFLHDAVIKLIGASIAVLGLVALYVTIRQRINDELHLRSRRTTLPPPAFKTRVTHDPATSTKRILFDDFQASFAPVDDDIESSDADEGSRRAAGVAHIVDKYTVPLAFDGPLPTPISDAPRRETTVPQRVFDALDDLDSTEFEDGEAHGESVQRAVTGLAGAPRDAVDSGTAFVDVTGESFRVIKPEGKQEPAQVADAARRDAVATGGRPVKTAAATQRPIAADAPSAEAAESHPAAESRPAAPPLRPATDEGRPERHATHKQAQFVVEDLVSDGDEDVRGDEPRAEFVRLVGQVLNAIARSIQARSIVFFWVNFDKGHIIPEAKVTTGRYDVRTGARIKLGTDVVSQIARSGVPEVISDISAAAERELIAYYTGYADTRSFVGVPVFFRRDVVGVLAADSTDENGFDDVSVATLAEYTRLIAGLIRSYTEKYDLHLIARTLDAFGAMSRDFSGTAPGPERAAELLVHHVRELFDTRYAAAVLFDEKEREWKVAAVLGDSGNPSLRGVYPDMRASVVGRTTRFAEEVLVENVTQEVRFDRHEALPAGGTFLAIPLVATTKCYGALAVEHPSPEAYIPRDIELMRGLARYAAMAIEVFNTNQAIQSHVVLDEVTGLYNNEFLLGALDREIARARDFKEKLSFALIAIDLPASLRAENSAELEEIIAGSVGSVIESAVRAYEVVGRLDAQRFGVVLVRRSDQDAYLWAEKLRKEVASSILALGDRKSAVTISVGISELGSHSTRESMIEGAGQALEKARSGEGNAVILF